MEYKYLSSIPMPLLHDFVNNRVGPFVGAGFSKNADIPKGMFMPDWKELGKIFSRCIPAFRTRGIFGLHRICFRRAGISNVAA